MPHLPPLAADAVFLLPGPQIAVYFEDSLWRGGFNTRIAVIRAAGHVSESEVSPCEDSCWSCAPVFCPA